MARKSRNRRKRQHSSAWYVEGSPETVRQFSYHRMVETLSAHQLEALQTLADMHELQVLAMLAQARGANLAAIRDALAEFEDGRQANVIDLMDRLGMNIPSLPPT